MEEPTVWDVWFDGHVHTLRRGAEFDIPVTQMRDLVVQMAADRNVSVNTVLDTENGVDALRVQCVTHPIGPGGGTVFPYPCCADAAMDGHEHGS